MYILLQTYHQLQQFHTNLLSINHSYHHFVNRMLKIHVKGQGQTIYVHMSVGVVDLCNAHECGCYS